MSKTAMIRARTEEDLKKEAEAIFKKLGLTVTEAINLFYTQVRLRKGLPFEVALPNKTTRKTFADTDAGKNLRRFKNKEEMFESLGM